MKYRIGIDVGSTTAKMVVVDEKERVVWSRYERHNARVKELLDLYFSEVNAEIGNAEVSICVTGSVGMAVSEMLQAEFVQEVVAASVYARERHPEAKTLIDIGGEDSKVVLLADGHTDLRMNGNCAGGTGAFIDQMAVLLGIGHQEMNDLALKASNIHTIAARCGVFAKTDVQNLVSRGVAKSDIAASIFHSVAVQTITTLARGAKIEPPILLCGGPLTFLPALRHAFADYMGIRESQFIVIEQSNLIPAIGCALNSGRATTSIAVLAERLATTQPVKTANSLPPLFTKKEELAAWQQEKRLNDIRIVPMQPREQVVIGIDSGSTTTKIVAARPDGCILFADYAQSYGNPVRAVADGLARLKAAADAQGARIDVVGSCSTGYGEELIKAAFNLDSGIIETMAHYRAAQRLQPNVSFILDIGGQDMKAIFVEQGVVKRVELNEACSSGCGTFLQTFAESLGHSIGDFAQMACTAQHPCDLGTRCTVFMNSKIKQVLREGAEVSDIAAGLAYSVINNCLYKVLKLRDTKELGGCIVVQGGTMRNDAVVRALELVTGCTVARSNMPEMMGAYGSALYATNHPSAARPLSELMAAARYETRQSECEGCENHCQIVRYKFTGGGIYYSGNKCERIFSNRSTAKTKGRNIYAEKYRLLFDRKINRSPQRIGLPRILNMYENYPFWHRLLTDCGFQVVLSSESKMQRYEQALCTVMSDNICFPAKLVHSHIAELEAAGVERILMPCVVYERKERLREGEQNPGIQKTATNSYNCPIVSGYSDVVRSAMSPQVPIDAPVINFGNKRLLKRQVTDYLKALGIPLRTIKKAFTAALVAQDEYELAIRQVAQSIFDDSPRQGRMTILLAGRPYHTDSLIQHRLGEMIASMGVNVISEDIVRQRPDLPDGETFSVRQWAYVNRIIKAAEWVASQDADVQFVQMTSFGCGPDAFIQDEVRSLLRRRGKTLTLLKIDDVSNVGSLRLRVRSLIDSLGNEGLATALRNHSTRGTDAVETSSPFTFHSSLKILAPHISEFITPLLPALGTLAGYDIEVLPPSNDESARIGLQYANNEVCYPATLIVGDIIKALQSGHYAQDRIAVAMSQTGGQCRATNYAGLIRRAMQQAGFQDVPLLTLGVTTNTPSDIQKSLHVSWRKMAQPVLTALLFADTIAKMYYSAVVREREDQHDMAAALRDKFLDQAANSIRHRNLDNLLWLTSNAAAEFNLITNDVTVPQVGIVGEIFLKFNHFAHQQLTDTLISRGIEVIPPLITPFFLQEFVNVVRNKQMGLTDSKIPNTFIRMLYALAYQRIRKFNEVASHYRYFRPFSDIRQTAAAADGIVSPAAQFGEGWLLPAEIAELAESGVTNILSLQPFGCIANHVVSKGIENAIRRRNPDLNLLSLDFDSGVSTVNVTNRLLLFLDNIGGTHTDTGLVAMR